MFTYQNFLRYILDNGIEKSDRTGTGTISTFVPPAMRFNLEQGFPLMTTKKLHWRSIAHELIWFLRGDTNIKYLVDNGVTIWNEWADANGDLGPVYGKQWRAWDTRSSCRDCAGTTTIDQIQDLIGELKRNPDGRRHIVTAWNPGEIQEMKLPPCHVLFQFYVAHGKLSCHLYQRSADAFLGVPFNIASYALLTHIIARLTNLEPGMFIHTCGDAHIYKNHLDQVNLQLSRTPRPLPKLVFSARPFTIDDIRFEDFWIEDYQAEPAIKAPVAV